MSRAAAMAAGAGAEVKTRRERVIEIIAVLMLGVATVGSAFSGYEATKWNGEEARLVRQASTEHVESARLFNLATQIIAYDTNIVAQYAASDGRQERRAEEVLPPDPRSAGVPADPRQMGGPDSRRRGCPRTCCRTRTTSTPQFADYRRVDASAVASTAASEVAGRNSDAFVLTAIILAVALFFAGVTSSFRYPPVRYLLLAAAAVTLAFSAARLADLPLL